MFLYKKQKICFFSFSLTGYDGHFILKTIGEMDGILSLDALPDNTEKMRMIKFNNFIMLDSCSFMQASLFELVQDLKKGSKVGGSKRGHKFEILEQIDLHHGKPYLKEFLLKKGTYPYEYAKSLEILQETKQIPDIKHFYSSLTNSNITEEEHELAKTVFDEFKCQNMVDYTELYCAT